MPSDSQKYSSNKIRLFPSIALVLLIIIYCFFLTYNYPKTPETTYAKTGTSPFEILLNNIHLSQTFLFSLTIILVLLVLGLVFCYGLGFFWGMLALLIFLSSAQFVLVFSSAPIWDVLNQLAPILSICVGLIIINLESTHSNRLTNRINQNLWARFGLISSTLIVFILLISVKNMYPPKLLLLCSLQLIAVAFSTSSQGIRIYQKVSPKLADSNAYVLTFLTIILTLLCMLQVAIGRTTSSIGALILGTSTLSILISKVRIHLLFRYLLFSYAVLVWILCFVLFHGGAPVLFYTLSGWQNAPQIWNGLAESKIQVLDPFADDFLWYSSVILQNLNVKSIVAFFTLFSNVNLNYFYQAFIIAFSYIFRFTEPPISLDTTLFWQIRSWLLSSFAPLCAPAAIFSVVWLFMKRGRVAIFVTLVVGINMIGVASTRPQLHQWWSLSLIGPMSVFFAIRLFLQKLPSVTFQSGLKTIKSIFSPLKGLSQLQRILPVALVFIVLTFFVGFLGKIGNINHLFSTFSSQQFKELQKSFNKLEWNPLELKANVEGDSPSIAIPNNVGAVQITTNANCTLSGLQVTFKRQSNLNSARYANGTLDRRVIVGETQSRKLYLNLKVPSNFSQQIFVWLPKFEKKCNLRVQTATLGSSLPAIALLIGDFVGEAHYHKKFSFRNVPTEDIRKFEFLNHQIRFRGYPKTNGYRAIGDDSNFGRPESQIGQRVLGTSFQGYMSVDLWSKTVPGHIAESSRSVTYDINLKRGVFAIGVTSSSEQNNVIEGYSVVGKGLQTSKRNFRGCFNIPQNPDSILFVASIVDMYSPRYLDASINSITFSTDTCSEGHRALLPTL